MYLSLSRRQPLYELLSTSSLKPKQSNYQSDDGSPRNSLRFLHHSLLSPYPLSSSPPNSPSRPRSCFRRTGAGLNKKRVVFADTKGLALTAVRLFIPEPSSPDFTLMKPSPAKLQGQQSISNKQQRYKFRLGFPQPTLDLKGFLAHLREASIQLESCSISEHSLIGKVCVSHVSVEKTVNLRVTFDSWRSHHDMPCTFLQQLPFGGSDVDVFAFDLCLPKNIDPNEGIEFCVYFRPGPGAATHWDDNRGQNYRVCVDKDGLSTIQGDANRFYPTLSKKRPPSWPSHVSPIAQNCAEVPYLQRSLINRVGAEWKSLSLPKSNQCVS